MTLTLVNYESQPECIDRNKAQSKLPLLVSVGHPIIINLTGDLRYHQRGPFARTSTDSEVYSEEVSVTALGSRLETSCSQLSSA